MADLLTTLDVEGSYGAFYTTEGYTQHHDGVPMWKTVDDLDRYRAVLDATRPEVVVETGTYRGGFALWLVDTFQVDVITVDVGGRHRGTPRPQHPRITYVQDDSVRAAPRVAELVPGRRCMVCLDSDHHAPHVEAEIRAYGPLVSPGCYLVVEDGLADLVSAVRARRFGACIPELGGPLAAIDRTLAADPRFERDVDVEGLTPLSHHPAGWWRRG